MSTSTPRIAHRNNVVCENNRLHRALNASKCTQCGANICLHIHCKRAHNHVIFVRNYIAQPNFDIVDV